MLKNRLLIVGIILSLSVVMLFLGNVKVFTFSVPKSLAPPVSESILQVRSEEALVEWVYTHSNRISKNVCKEIVKEAIKMPKPLLLLAIMEVESNFVPTATSSKNAIGLMQILPSAWDKDLIKRGDIGERRDLYDINTNIRCGSYIFQLYLNQAKGNIDKALELYLGGKDGVYVKRILTNLASLYLLVDARLG
uniref:Putative transglycosylase n=2 Tax=viral metagenome TaxID=1070528 RepID=A0A6M3IUK0_9ZZZZ